VPDDPLRTKGKAAAAAEPVAETPVKLELTASRQLPAWMHEHRLSLAFTTYEAGKLFFIGLRPGGRLSVFERTFSRCMGLCAEDGTLWMTSLYQLWRMENALAPSETHEEHDRLYVPRIRQQLSRA
jgi:uncharacterized protein (TIGR03032 family)